MVKPLKNMFQHIKPIKTHGFTGYHACCTPSELSLQGQHLRAHCVEAGLMGYMDRYSWITLIYNLYIYYSWITMITYVGDRDTGIPIETAGFSELDCI